MDTELISLNWHMVAEIVKACGPTGILMVLWFFSRRDTDKMFLDYQRDTSAMLKQYQKDMQEQREMYKNNVELVKRVLAIADNQQDVIILNTQMMQRLVDRIESNQFCPMVRLSKVPPIDGIRP